MIVLLGICTVFSSLKVSSNLIDDTYKTLFCNIAIIRKGATYRLAHGH